MPGSIKTYATPLCLLLLLMGCNAKRLENTKELSREIKASQIKRVTNTQLITTIDEWGKKISEIAQKSLEKELQNQPGKAGFLCKHLNVIPVLNALEKEYGVDIELLGAADLKNPKFLSKELEIYEAYLFSAKNKPTNKDNIQELNDTLIVYNVPVGSESTICKACMPADTTKFGLWRLLFNKRQAIRKLDAKALK